MILEWQTYFDTIPMYKEIVTYDGPQVERASSRVSEKPGIGAKQRRRNAQVRDTGFHSSSNSRSVPASPASCRRRRRRRRHREVHGERRKTEEPRNRKEGRMRRIGWVLLLAVLLPVVAAHRRLGATSTESSRTRAGSFPARALQSPTLTRARRRSSSPTAKAISKRSS